MPELGIVVRVDDRGSAEIRRIVELGRRGFDDVGRVARDSARLAV